MSKLSSAIYEICNIENQASKNKWINQIHPLVKLFITLFYISLVVAFDKYSITGLMGMVLYPLVVFLIADIPFFECIKRVKFILPVVCIIGVFNPIFDQKTMLFIAGFSLSFGVISMLTLVIKGILTVLAAYLLIITTTIEKICTAMRMLHIPQTFVTVILLTYRYINVLLKEADRIMQAYALRAPKQKGIHFEVWGSLVGQLLLRSMDRATDIYDSMNLRGYGMATGHYANDTSLGINIKDIAWLCIWTLVLLVIRHVPIFQIVGNIFV
jgi:cobalt/nickel transport system permease protein